MITTLLAAAALAKASPCQLSPSDRRWLSRSVAAWQVTRRTILKSARRVAVEAWVFDRSCLLKSGSALTTGSDRWTASRIQGAALHAGDQVIPVGVMSATMGDARTALFVMSTPSVWAANKVSGGTTGLPVLMTAVMMHEASHVLQRSTYGRRIASLQEANKLSDEQFNDDAIQAKFGGNAEFSNSVARETELFFAAAAAPSDAEAVRLATEARTLMRKRAARWFVGDQAYQSDAEDLWLTMEGSGQWSGYQWLRLPIEQGGAGLSHAAAMEGFGQGGKWWSQKLGLAMVMTLDRLGSPGWQRTIYGDGRFTLGQLLDRRLGPSAS